MSACIDKYLYYSVYVNFLQHQNRVDRWHDNARGIMRTILVIGKSSANLGS